MISERKFAEKFTSFWHDALPAGAAVSRYVNLQRTRFAPPVQSQIPPKRRALVNELSFRLFTEQVRGGRLMDGLPQPARQAEIGRQVAEELAAELPLPAADESPAPSAAELGEAAVLADRLARFFNLHAAGEQLTPMPEFAGCGILESCRGDVLAGTTLYEVKSGEASFRLVDLRQVLIYCALNHALPRYPIREAGLVNPRLGVFFTADLDTLVWAAAGIPADSLFFEMTYFLASQGVSV